MSYRIMKIFLYITLFFSLMNYCKKPISILSEEHVKNKVKKYTDVTELSNQASMYLKKGDSLSKEKKYTEAIKEYETGLNNFPTAELYYSYGNTLANIKNYADAIKAYELANYLNYEKSHLVYYNIACMYSLLKDKDNSFKNIIKALDEGYTNLNHIHTDSDLAWLREVMPDVNLLIDENHNKILNFQKDLSPVGKHFTEGFNNDDDYFLCGNLGDISGNYIQKHADYGGWVISTKSIGKWKLAGNNIHLNHLKEYQINITDERAGSFYYTGSKVINKIEKFDLNKIKLEKYTGDCPDSGYDK